MVDTIIVGAGPAGLAAALFAARRGHTVTVLDSDPPPPGCGTPDDDVAWERRGVPHARQGHVFLARSTAILREEAGDVLDALWDRGAVRAPLEGDASAANVLARRLVHEAALRRAVERQPRVTILSNVTVSALCVAGKRSADGIPHVIGVSTRHGETLTADWVVDASGRRSGAPGWLRAAGARPLDETRQPCGFFYITRHYRLRRDASFPTTAIPIVAALSYLTVLAFPGDNRRFQLSIAVSIDDPLRRRLMHGQIFDRFLAEVPLTRAWLERGVPLTEPEPMAGIENRRRSLVRDGAPVVSGFLLLGDASVQTNPTTGRGISLALMQAVRFAQMLEQAERSTHAVGMVRDFEAWTAAHLGGWLKAQMDLDGVRVRQLKAGLGRERPPAVRDPTNRLVAALAALRDEDSEIRAIVSRLYNLLLTQEELMANTPVFRRILAYMRRHPEPAASAQGLDRAAFERLVAAA